MPELLYNAYDFVDIHWVGLLAILVMALFVAILVFAFAPVLDKRPHPAHDDPDHQRFKEKIVELEYKLD